MSKNSYPQDKWLEITGTVTSCHFQFARLNTFTLGLPTTRRYRITFDYYVHGRLYSDEFQSDNALPQNTPLPLTYNPFDPKQNSRTSGPLAGPTRSPLIAIGIAGSIVLSLAWLLVLRSCSPT